VEYIAKHAEMTTIFVSKTNLKALLSVVPELTHQKDGCFLERVVQFDENKLYGNTCDSVDEKDIAACEAHGVKLMAFSAVIAAGSADPRPNPPVPEDWAFIMYTSGTTGTPKGAILTHKNLVATMSATDSRFTLSNSDRHISYLPLAHIFETIVEHAMYMYGGSVGFFQGNIKLLTSDQMALRPTIWCGVPRVFDKVFKTVMGGVESGSCGNAIVFNRAYSVQAELCRRSAYERDGTWDWIFKKVRAERLGLDQVRYIITGAAPCPPYLMEFLKILIGCPVIQGYGMTETSAAATIMATTDIYCGHNGAPLPCNEIKLVDVPEMNYLHTDTPNPRGEIWIRGDNIFMGYYKNPEATKSDKTEDGWLKTGDIGRWNNNGTLSIIDRKKNIFKLSQGEYIAAEKCEQAYAKGACCGQIFVYGNSYKSFVVAVVVPQPAPIYEFCKSKSWWPAPADDEEAKLREVDAKYFFSAPFMTCWNKVFTDHYPEIKAHVFGELKEQNKNLKSFERVRDIHVEHRVDATGAGFTEANECITPTFKLRRPFLLKRYNAEIKALYTANGEAPAASENW
jgi:long-chain acyl-CoA synthetase